MIDYFVIYKCILEVIHDEKVSDAFKLFDFLSYKDELFEMRSKFPKRLMVDATLEVLDNLIDDGLVIAKVKATSSGKLYLIERLSTAGQMYLLSFNNPSTKQKTMRFLKDNGLPMNPQSITKALINIFL